MCVLVAFYDLESFIRVVVKEVNIVPEAVPVWPLVRYISDTDQYRCTISDLSLYYIYIHTHTHTQKINKKI